MDNSISLQRRAGFTLVELVVTIAIAGILIALAAPSFVTTTQKMRALGEANGFANDLQFARSEAIKRGQPVSLCVSSNGTSCLTTGTWQQGWIVFADPLGDLTVSAATTLRVQKSWIGSDTFKDLVAPSTATSSITFSREGFLAGSTAIVLALHTTPSNSAATQCVELKRTGRQRVLSNGVGSCT